MKNQENHGVHFGADQNEMQTSDPVFATGTCEQGPPRHGPPNDLGNAKPPKTTFWNKSAFLNHLVTFLGFFLFVFPTFAVQTSCFLFSILVVVYSFIVFS